MLTPSIGSPGGDREYPVTNNPPEAPAISVVARNTLKKSFPKISKPTKFEFKADMEIPNDEETRIANKFAFEFFEYINEANAKP
jgi:hypothetical protein